MTPWLRPYRLAARAAGWIRGSSVLARSIAGRLGAADRWTAWAAAAGPAPRTVWFHAASVGEALTAEPVMRRLRAADPAARLVLTHSSPSVSRWPTPLPADRVDFVPMEAPAAARRVFAALEPSALVFSRGDLWPELLLAARQHGVPVAVLGAVVGARSLRGSWPARALLAPLYRNLRWVGAVGPVDAARWRALGALPGRVVVTGDPRHDQVLERPTSLAPLQPVARWAAGAAGTVVVAGSVEAADAAPLARVFAMVRARYPEARLVVVPHEPHPEILRVFGRTSVTRWEAGGSAPDRAAHTVIVEAVGLLGDLYALADVAYVGGGFGSRGVHATIEPAAFAVPTVTGGPGGAAAIAARILGWLGDPPAARRAGLDARRTLATGASRASARHILELLREPGERG